MHLHVVGVVVLAPGVRIGHHYLGSDPPDDRHQASDRLYGIGGGEGVRVGIVLGFLHAGVPVAEHRHLVVADDRSRPGQLGLADRRQVGTHLGSVHLRIQDVASLTTGTAHQHAVHALGVQAGDGGRPLGGLVVRMGVDGQKAQRGVGWNGGHGPRRYRAMQGHRIRRGHHARHP